MRKSKEPPAKQNLATKQKPAVKPRKTKPRGETVQPEPEVAAPAPSDDAARQSLYAELRFVGTTRFYKPGWAAMKYKAAIGWYPPWEWNEQPERKPSAQTLEWVERELAAYARSRGRQHASAASPSRTQTMRDPFTFSWTSPPPPPRSPDDVAIQAAIAKEEAQWMRDMKATDAVAKPSPPHAELIDGGCLLYRLPASGPKP
jgi:hypothetical protein